MSSFFFCLIQLCCNEKTQTNDKNKNIEFETEKRKLREIKTKKMSFDMGVTFPLSQDSELGDKDLNNLVEESKAKNTTTFK